MGENALNKLSIPSFLVDANPPPKWEMSSVDEPWFRSILKCLATTAQNYRINPIIIPITMPVNWSSAPLSLSVQTEYSTTVPARVLEDNPKPETWATAMIIGR